MTYIGGRVSTNQTKKGAIEPANLRILAGSRNPPCRCDGTKVWRVGEGVRENVGYRYAPDDIAKKHEHFPFLRSCFNVNFMLISRLIRFYLEYSFIHLWSYLCLSSCIYYLYPLNMAALRE